MDITLLSYLGLGASGLALINWRFKKQDTTFGSAEFLKPWVASRKGMFRKGGLLLGDWTGNLPVYYRGTGHALTVAPTGYGKGVATIVPNLLRHNFIFLIDPGGENTAIAARAWRRKGYAFSCLNPWSMHAGAPWSLPSHSINPLNILDPASESFVSDADLLSDMIVTRTGKEQGSAAFFKNEAQSGIRGMLMHIMTAEPPERRTLTTLRQYIAAGPQAFCELIAVMKQNQAVNGAIAREAEQMERREAQAPEEFSAVFSTMKEDTNFLEDPVMQRALAASTSDIADLKGMRDGKELRGAVVSVVIPLEYIDTHAAYARLVVGCALWTMQRAPLAQGRVLFVLDEFAALKRMNRISSGLATLRKYRVWLWPIVQNITQLTELYGDNWQTFVSNAGLRIFMGAGDAETARYVSQICGETTIDVRTKAAHGGSVSPAARALATLEEVMHASSEQQIVFVDNLKPMVLRKTPYWERPRLRGTFDRNPYQSVTPGLPLRLPLDAVAGVSLRFISWLMAPSPTIVALSLFILAAWSNIGISLGRDAEGKNPACVYLQAHGVTRGYMRSARSECPYFIFTHLGRN